IKDPEKLLIRNEFIEVLSKGIREEKEYKKFRQRMYKLGLAKSKINRIISRFNSQNTSLYEDRFQYIATSGGKDSQEFAVAIVRLLRKIGFDAFHTGNLKRPSGSGGYADAYIVYDNDAYIFDAKASEYYSISHSDWSKACQTYIPTWEELHEVHNLPKADLLKLFGYIAGGYKVSGNLEGRLLEIKEKTGIQASALTAWDFFKYVQKSSRCSPDDFISKVMKGGNQHLN